MNVNFKNLNSHQKDINALNENGKWGYLKTTSKQLEDRFVLLVKSWLIHLTCIYN